MFSWISHNLIAFFGSVVTLIGVIAGLIRSSKSDANAATKERNNLEKFILKTVRDDNEDLRKRYDDLSAKYEEMSKDYDDFKNYHDKIVKKLQEQVDLKEEENKNLRQKNAVLKKENAAYRARYGKLEE